MFVKLMIFGLFLEILLQSISGKYILTISIENREVEKNKQTNNKCVCVWLPKGFITRAQCGIDLWLKKVLLPPPLMIFADIVYRKEQSFLIQMRAVCTLYAGA